ncbi:hypothetical protein [Candidatus Methanodesulfokora washburnensis]|uniref:Uncharacterized protein n=1 Tax=Candidatus Methanodesulfokora washburnensis TaxID=2478471 RepID=A0A3R9QUA1_9CREN|nr:hypothetical protein [Candidatus Methanodesulfokores washburnensis]RSN72284.1 hypothetical protein D6D85_14525 [Candidatus Methanodesulfokores washburnensis]
MSEKIRKEMKKELTLEDWETLPPEKWGIYQKDDLVFIYVNSSRIFLDLKRNIAKMEKVISEYSWLYTKLFLPDEVIPCLKGFIQVLEFLSEKGWKNEFAEVYMVLFDILMLYEES